MDIRPIKTEDDYEAVLLEIECLFDALPGSERADRLDVLTTLVQAYDAKNHPIGLPDPIAAIEYELEKRGLTRQDLENVIGKSGRVSEILNRQRRLTITMVRRLGSEFGLSADVLIADYPLVETAKAKRSARRSQRQTSVGGELGVHLDK